MGFGMSGTDPKMLKCVLDEETVSPSIINLKKTLRNNPLVILIVNMMNYIKDKNFSLLSNRKGIGID